MRFHQLFIPIAASLFSFTACQQHDTIEKATDSEPSSPQKTSANKQLQAGQRVFIDPNTGEFISQPSDSGGATTQGLVPEAPTDASLAGLEQTVLPDGTVSIKLDDRFNKPLVATMDCDGNVEIAHRGTATSAPSPDCSSKEGGEK